MGFDAQNSVYTNMFEAGIIDPTKVTRTGIVDRFILFIECHEVFFAV